VTKGRDWVAAMALGAVLLGGCVAGRGNGNGSRPKVDYRVVSPAVAFTLLQDNENLIVIDLRSAGDYAGPDGHLNGAANIPLAVLGDRLKGLHELRRRTFLVYCDGTDCGPQGMRLLRDHGFQYVVLMDGGLPRWKKEGFGVVHGAERRVAPNFP
jgi:rhodanese-related sulfurtransferase